MVRIQPSKKTGPREDKSSPEAKRAYSSETVIAFFCIAKRVYPNRAIWQHGKTVLRNNSSPRQAKTLKMIPMRYKVGDPVIVMVERGIAKEGDVGVIDAVHKDCYTVGFYATEDALIGNGK